LLVEQLKKNHLDSNLDDKDLAMLNYAAKLTLEPWNMNEDDVVSLRNEGFPDAAILDICQVTGYFAFVNRLADGLGVELEHYWEI
jgi:uncharacterized peroxidase-related enzyme